MLDLAAMLTSDDPNITENEENQIEYFRKLKWETSDSNVVIVKNGYIEAVGPGTALITCSTMKTDGYMYSIKLKLDVRDKEIEENDDIDIEDETELPIYIDGSVHLPVHTLAAYGYAAPHGEN